MKNDEKEATSMKPLWFVVFFALFVGALSEAIYWYYGIDLSSTQWTIHGPVHIN